MKPWDCTPFYTAHGKTYWDYVDHDLKLGKLGKAIVDAFPHLECIVFDLPHVVTGLQDRGNLRYVGGDMFEDVSVAETPEE
ncbi:hypothetical protein V6N11_055353 [Hibiscus sabdariffa]|uniref:O-methyltransferase C-terminal domain-containing protein n=1 Tax=Hibiscus sabdariffa TaxID=183260 RepID=A0ABR2PF03_9ROSI